MNAETVSLIVLVYLLGFVTPYLWHWIEWTLSKRRPSDWGEWE